MKQASERQGLKGSKVHWWYGGVGDEIIYAIIRFMHAVVQSGYCYTYPIFSVVTELLSYSCHNRIGTMCLDVYNFTSSTCHCERLSSDTSPLHFPSLSCIKICSPPSTHIAASFQSSL